MTFRVIIHDDVRKKIKKIPKEYQKNIVNKLSMLSQFPHFLDIKKVKDQASAYRVRIGSYRAIFDVDFNTRVIYVTALSIRGRTEY